MSTLTKGQLVMTEHGLAWYNDKATMSINRYFVKWLDGQDDALDGTPSPATREQVEAYLKEKGFDKYTEYSFYKGTHLGYDVLWRSTGWFISQPSTLIGEAMDTAPAQLAEAILCARLLNATKD